MHVFNIILEYMLKFAMLFITTLDYVHIDNHLMDKKIEQVICSRF